MRLEDENASFRFNQEGLRKFLGDLECEIMELVWKLANPTVTVRDVFDALRQERQIAYTTVMTTMVRLSEKGLLKIVDKIGLANCYMPEYEREEFISTAVHMILDIFTSQFPRESKDFLEQYQAKQARRTQRKK
jgi:predicted transcriptional regulator